MKESPHVPVLDAWRGLAISLLLFGHFYLRFPGVQPGQVGVELFFVLSGFLMGRLLFIKRTPLKTFYQRRISRIFPAAYTFLIVCWVYKFASRSWVVPDVAGTISCFFFYVNYLLAFDPKHDIGIPADHFWSLCVEEHAYIFLSLLAILVRRFNGYALILLSVSALACFGMAVWLDVIEKLGYYSVYWRSDTHAASIILGAIASLLVARGFGSRKAYFGVSSRWWGILFLLIGLGCQINRVPNILKYTVGTGFLASALLLISQHVTYHVVMRPLIWLGTVSFSLYLWQQPFYHAQRDLGIPVAFACSIAAGLASFYLVEQPVRIWLNSHWKPSLNPQTQDVRSEIVGMV